MSNDETTLDHILLAEGGFVDHPADKGSATNRGITLSTLSAWRKRAVTVDELRALTEAEARSIYRAQYIDEPGFNQIPDDKLRGLVVDSGVNHGPASATRMLQKALGVPVDGVFGVATHAAVIAQDPRAVYLRLCAERCRFYGNLITKKASQAVFAKGWAERLAKFIEAAA